MLVCAANQYTYIQRDFNVKRWCSLWRYASRINKHYYFRIV